MGISVLIPVYNDDPVPLLQSLLNQVPAIHLPISIYVGDDASNRPVADGLPPAMAGKVTVIRNAVNRGRAATRRMLADQAEQDYLLFIDADSEIPGDDFLQNYANEITRQPEVLTGGRIYDGQPPADCSLALHWRYGSEREARANFGDRQAALQSNNFLIRRQLFRQLTDPAGNSNYGHEDTAWGMQLKQKNIEIERIPNPVKHARLETADEFLRKSEQAVAALAQLAAEYPKKTLMREVRLYRVYVRLKVWGLLGPLILLAKTFHPFIMANLHSCRPSLLYFDCWRIVCLHNVMKK